MAIDELEMLDADPKPAVTRELLETLRDARYWIVAFNPHDPADPEHFLGLVAELKRLHRLWT